MRQWILFSVFCSLLFSCSNADSIVLSEKYNGSLFLAFREGPNHLPSCKEEYGGIRVMQYINGVWSTKHLFHVDDWDLRDPYFMIVNGKLRIYIGYNQVVNGGWEHIATVFSDLDNGEWGNLTPISHDVPHNVWLWKARHYKGHYYGVGYLENMNPVFLTSNDGVNWSSLAEFEISGVPTEADCCFINDTCYMLIRRDVPKGSYAYWGVSVPPYDNFLLRESRLRVDCPDMLYLPESDQIILAGREWVYYENRENEFEPVDSINCSLFELDKNGDAQKLDVLVSVKKMDRIPDNSYPSIVLYRDTMFVSYYNGFSKTEVRMAKYQLNKNLLGI